MQITRKELSAIRDLMQNCVGRYKLVICGEDMKSVATCTGCGKQKQASQMLSIKHSYGCPHEKYWDAQCILAKIFADKRTQKGKRKRLNA